jgi:prolyl 4-hydroxylase
MSLPAKWKEWVIDQLLRGGEPTQILSTIIQNGFTFEAGKKLLGSNLPANIGFFKDAAFFERLSHPPLLDALEQYNAEYLESEKAQLIRLDNFMSAEDCAEIIRLTKTKLRPSEIATETGYAGFRTSSTCDLTFLNHDAAFRIDQKIIDCLGIDVGTTEIIQAQHYGVGQQFKAHHDYFEPGSAGYLKYSRDGGQRTWTFMVYLNQECEGGETEFPHLRLKFRPKTGTAIIWNNLLADGTINPNTLHQAHPITLGEKVVITKWFREENRDVVIPKS